MHSKDYVRSQMDVSEDGLTLTIQIKVDPNTGIIRVGKKGSPQHTTASVIRRAIQDIEVFFEPLFPGLRLPVLKDKKARRAA